jgi:hypothetical protein
MQSRSHSYYFPTSESFLSLWTKDKDFNIIRNEYISFEKSATKWFCSNWRSLVWSDEDQYLMIITLTPKKTDKNLGEIYVCVRDSNLWV